MIAPAAFENVTFPDQKSLDWSSYESLEWLRAGGQYFNSKNGITYGAPITIGPNFGATAAKFSGVALAYDGCLYGLSSVNQSAYLKIDTYTDAVTTIPFTPTGPSSLASAYNGFTNSIYSDMRFNTMAVFNVGTQTYTTITKPYTGEAIMIGASHNGRRMYFHGFYVIRRMYYIDALTNTVVDTGVTWTGDRLTGALAWNNKFYLGNGGGSTNILVYDANNDTTTTITGGQAIAADQYRNFIQYYDGFMYTFGGFGSNKIKRVNPATNQMIDVFTMPATNYNWNDYAIGADGKIYCVGASNQLGIYDPITNTLSTVTLPGSSYEGLAIGALGDLYAIPFTAPFVVKIPVQNAGNTLKALQEFNGIISRHQAP